MKGTIIFQIFMAFSMVACSVIMLRGHSADEMFNMFSVGVLMWSILPYISLWAISALLVRRNAFRLYCALLCASPCAVSFDLVMRYKLIFLPSSSTDAVGLIFLPFVTGGIAIVLGVACYAVLRVTGIEFTDRQGRGETLGVKRE